MPALARALRGSASTARAKKLNAASAIAHFERGAAGAVQRGDAARIERELGEVAPQFGAGAPPCGCTTAPGRRPERSCACAPIASRLLNPQQREAAADSPHRP